ncbi:MAG: hypothetical protein AAGC65_12790 [Mucilaginibacter sp.]|uniref:hypothetical protein n=1 Tax=Mucilaginibacter sp. TaxID=1882438 RepID=UPI0031A5916A
MKRKYFTAFSMIMLCMVMILDVNAQSVSEKENVRTFVQKFYDWYIVLYKAPVDKKHPVCSCEIAVKQRPEYFDAHLRKALIDDYAAQAKAKGEIVGLDSDPFLGGQDIGLGYQTGKVKSTGNKFLVDIHDIGKGKSEKETLAAPIAVIAEVTKVAGHPVFTNFIFLDDGKQYSLLQMLKDLSNERNNTK